MKALSRLVARVVVGLALLAAVVRPAAADADADYLALLAAAKGDPTSIDYTALRAAYAASRFYKGYASDPMNLRVPTVNPTEAEVRTFVNDNFAIWGTPLLALGKLKPASGSAESNLYIKAEVKLFEAIAQTGNGQSAATAWKVLAVSEEYALCMILGVKVETQVTLNQDGRQYDVLNVRLADGRGPIPLWFDISAFFGRR